MEKDEVSKKTKNMLWGIRLKQDRKKYVQIFAILLLK